MSASARVANPSAAPAVQTNGAIVQLKQAQIVINQWLRQYNQTRPHQALNMRPPVPETLTNASGVIATPSQAVCRGRAFSAGETQFDHKFINMD